MAKLLAWLVHLYTSFGLVCGLLALHAVGNGEPRLVFAWLALAYAIDCTDGMLARRVRVEIHVPRFSGAKLDDITDYLNYTFVPIVFLLQQGLLDETWLPLLGFTLIASAYGFCSEGAKTSDGYFTGFPSYWNVVAFYAYYIEPPQWLLAAVVAALAVMTFWPIRYLYPSKNRHWQLLSVGGGVIWACGCLWLLAQEHPPIEWVYGTLVYPAWYMGVALWMRIAGPPQDAQPAA